jgi:hypothetical protein
MPSTKLNRQINAALIETTGRRYCRTGSHDASAVGGRQDPGKPWTCQSCCDKIDAAKARRKS